MPHPIHPTEAFDMIVGTSTGGLISMALLAGQISKSDRDTDGMSVEDVKQMYLGYVNPTKK